MIASKIIHKKIQNVIYILIFILIAFLAYLYDINKLTYKRIELYWILFWILVLFAGLRYRVGSDTIVYIGMFEYTPPITKLFSIGLDKFNYEPLWMIYFSFWKYIGSFYLFQLSTAFIINFSIFKFAKKYTRNIFSFVLFYYLLFYIGNNFEAIRQGVAISVAIWAFPYWKNKKWIKYFIISFISFNIHDSAVIMFITPLLRYINFKLKYFFALLIVLCFYVLLEHSILLKINNLLSLYYAGIGIVDKFSIYAEMDTSHNVNYYINHWYIPVIFIPSLLIYTHHANIKVNNLNIIFLFCFFGIIMSFMSVLGRLGNYLYIFIIMFISDLFVIFVRRSKLNIKSRFILFIIALTPPLFINYMSQYEHHRFYKKYYPYSSIFHEFKDSDRESTTTDNSGITIYKTF